MDLKIKNDFESIYKEYAPQVYRYLLKLGCPPQDAEDITHDTFVKALLHIEQYRGEGKLSIWLCQIAKNTWFNNLRKNKKETPTLVFDEENIVHDESLIEWIDVIDKLEEPYRSVFLDRSLGEYEYIDIARKYGKTESWARVTYHRAKPKLRELLEERRG